MLPLLFIGFTIMQAQTIKTRVDASVVNVILTSHNLTQVIVYHKTNLLTGRRVVSADNMATTVRA